jgi:hypothetical protein
MPSTMIHLLVAYEINPKAPDLFWIGNFAPDYTNDRQFKDEIHLRNTVNRMEALKKLREKIDDNNPFESGWLLHLFVDACWDKMMIPAFQQKYENNCVDQDWFIKYREEISLASYYLYHHTDWAPQIWIKILNADLSSIVSVLPITQHETEWYRKRLYSRHAESNFNSVSAEYDKEQIMSFSRKTVLKYKEWMGINNEKL